MKSILVTGGTGFIGSHTCFTLLEKGYHLVVLDSYVNSSPIVIERLEKLLDSPFADKAPKDVVEKERQRLTEYRASRDTLAKRLQELQQ